MIKHLHRLLQLVSATTAGVSAHAEDVILRLAPSEQAAIISRINHDAPEIQAGRSVLEAPKAAQGWKWTEYTTTLDGYIPADSLSKNFDIAPDTFVRARPTSTANVLTRVESGDRLKVIASNDTWATVRFRKAVPVYFIAQQTAAAIKPDKTAFAAQNSRGSQIHINPNGKVANLAPGELPPENVIWRKAPTSHPTSTTAQPTPPAPTSIMVASAQTHAPETPRMPEMTADSPIRALTGTLVRAINNNGARYPIRLQSAPGHRIAYVDMAHLFINDLRPYLNQTVQVIGNARPLVPGSRELIIEARSLRITQ